MTDEDKTSEAASKQEKSSPPKRSGGATRGMGDLLAMLRQQQPTSSEPSSGVSEKMDVESISDAVIQDKEAVESVVQNLVSTVHAKSGISAEQKATPTSQLAPSDDVREERKERKKASGMAAILQQLRGATEAAAPTTSTENKEKETLDEKSEVAKGSQMDLSNVDLSKLNRKERRALLQKQREAEGFVEKKSSVQSAEEVKEEPAVKIPRFEVPFNLWDGVPERMFVESDAFSAPVPSFGFSSCSNNYVKLAKFSPIGTHLASTSQDRRARIFKLDEESCALSLCSTISLGDLPYDAVWHPCGDLLATSAKDHPIHLWNTEGAREATYRGINHLDELSGAYTMSFSPDGLKMYAGYNKCIRIWDVRRPGRQMREVKTWKTQPYKQGQKAIVSSLALHPFYDGVYAVGTYGSSIGLYSDRTNFIECQFGGDFAAITDLKYSNDGMKLFSCGRKNNAIHCWDMRNPGKLLFALERPFGTNQKIYFDIDGADRYLFSGTSNGEIVIFDLQTGEEKRAPSHTNKVAECAVPCVSAHPRLPLLAVCTGERVFPYPSLDNENDGTSLEPSTNRTYLDSSKNSQLQNSVQLWKY